MNACLQPGNLISRSSERTLSIRLTALFSVVLLSTGCASFNRSGDPRPLSSASSLDTKSLASSGAGIAFSRAESAERDGKTDTAIRYYEQARTLDPNLAHLSRRLAVLYDQRGDDGDRCDASTCDQQPCHVPGYAKSFARELRSIFPRCRSGLCLFQSRSSTYPTGPNRRSSGTLSTRAGIRSDGSSSRRVSQSTGPCFRGNAFFVIRLSSRACQLSGRV